MTLIDQRRGLRRRPLWEFEIDTARQQLNLQFGTRDLSGFGVEQAHLALRAAGCLQYVKDTQRTSLPHIRSLSMERQQDSVIMDAATRRNLEITRIWRAAAKIRSRRCWIKPSRRWAAACEALAAYAAARRSHHHAPPESIAELQSLSEELQPVLRRWAIWSVFWHVWRCAPRVRAIWHACVMPSSNYQNSIPS